MKAEIGGLARLTVYIRPDVKDGMRNLQVKRLREGSGYVSLGQIFAEGAILLLDREGMPLGSAPAAGPLPRRRSRKGVAA
jgi:hypothetical protein